MEMTLRRLGLHQISPVIKNMGLPLGILMLVAMMVLPLPSFLLDIFFTSNILLSLLILMVAMNAFRPLDFSSFPTILLFATILRLGLNVASTRVVLSQGHTGTDAAGKVIEAFGAFVVAGNYVVGIFVFIILVIINLLVITKGAGRVSEVSARFTLDAMPGKQMAIDADLNAGALTTEEAKQAQPARQLGQVQPVLRPPEGAAEARLDRGLGRDEQPHARVHQVASHRRRGEGGGVAALAARRRVLPRWLPL